LPSQQQGIKRTDLQRHDLSVPAREVAGSFVSQAHSSGRGDHLCPRRLSRVWVEGKEPVTLKAGDVLFISAGKIHAAKNVGNGDGSELATYVVEKGKPLVVLVK